QAQTSVWQELATPAQRDRLARLAGERRWGLSLLLVGWLHLGAFALCYFLTVGLDYHEPAGYPAVWAGGVGAAGLTLRLCGLPRLAPARLVRARPRRWPAWSAASGSRTSCWPSTSAR